MNKETVKREPVTIYTDGSCIGNPGPGGWAAIIILPGKGEVACYGNSANTTNNCMELTAVVAAIEKLNYLNRPCDVTVVTDSTYVMTDKVRMAKWLRNPGKYKNMDLWMKLINVAQAGNHKITYQHVFGHSGDEYNERCDRYAKEQAALVRTELAKRRNRSA